MSVEPAGTRTPLRVVHLITRLIVAGAQENTMLTAAHMDRARYRSEIWAGPQTGSEGDLREACARLGIPVRSVPHLVREIHPARDLAACRGLVRLLRRERVDVVHTHSSKAGILGRFAARAAGVPGIVHTVHGWSFHDRMSPAKRRAYVGLERAAARACHRLITVAETDRAKGLRERIGRPEQYVTIRSAVDLAPYAAPVDRDAVRRELGIPAGAPLVITVGRFSEQKDPLTFAAVAARVAAARPGVRFVWVGDGPLRGRFAEEVARLGIGDSVQIPGVRHDIPRVLGAADLFLLTSLWEGLPRVLVEAAAAGLPVVATAVDGTPELVVDGETGFLAPPGDVPTLAGRVGAILGTPGLAARLGAASRRRLGAEFDVRSMAAGIATVYEALPTGRGSRR